MQQNTGAKGSSSSPTLGDARPPGSQERRFLARGLLSSPRQEV